MSVTEHCNAAQSAGPPHPQPTSATSPFMSVITQGRKFDGSGWLLRTERHGNGETATAGGGAALFPGIGICTHEQMQSEWGPIFPPPQTSPNPEPGHNKCRPISEPVFRAKKTDRATLWCLFLGPDSGPKKVRAVASAVVVLAASAVRFFSWLGMGFQRPLPPPFQDTLMVDVASPIPPNPPLISYAHLAGFSPLRLPPPLPRFSEKAVLKSTP